MIALRFKSTITMVAFLGSILTLPPEMARAVPTEASLSSEAPPIAIDRCTPHPWYLAFLKQSHTSMLPIAQIRIAEMVKRWKQDHGPVLISGRAPQASVGQARQKYIAGLLISQGIDPKDIYFNSSGTGTDAAVADPDFADVIQVNFPYEGRTCRVNSRTDRMKWLIQHCRFLNADQSETCRTQIEALETD